jgi:uncharacterized membrane protein YqjE
MPVRQDRLVGRQTVSDPWEEAMTVSAENGRPVQTHTDGLSEASIGDLAARLSEQVSRLVRDELALAQVEAKQKAKKLGLGVGMFGASAVLALLGAGAGVACAILAVHVVLNGWQSALVVAGALFIGAGMVAMVGRLGIAGGTPPIPTGALESTKADVAAVREAVKR